MLSPGLYITGYVRKFQFITTLYGSRDKARRLICRASMTKCEGKGSYAVLFAHQIAHNLRGRPAHAMAGRGIRGGSYERAKMTHKLRIKQTHISFNKLCHMEKRDVI